MTPAKMLAPSDLRRCRSARLFCQSGAFVPNGAIRQYGHNCQPPVAAAGVSPLLHHDGKIHPRRFLLLAYPNATWQRLDLLSWRERSRRRFTRLLIPAETEEEGNLGRQQRCRNICKKNNTPKKRAHSLCIMRFQVRK